MESMLAATSTIAGIDLCRLAKEKDLEGIVCEDVKQKFVSKSVKSVPIGGCTLQKRPGLARLREA
jgi:hypothetical protein